MWTTVVVSTSSTTRNDHPPGEVSTANREPAADLNCEQTIPSSMPRTSTGRNRCGFDKLNHREPRRSTVVVSTSSTTGNPEGRPLWFRQAQPPGALNHRGAGFDRLNHRGRSTTGDAQPPGTR